MMTGLAWLLPAVQTLLPSALHIAVPAAVMRRT
jgi:hypothetical protein